MKTRIHTVSIINTTAITFLIDSNMAKFTNAVILVSPYQHLEKSTVLQSARIFHDPQVVRNDPRKCCTVIGQLLHLQNGMGVSLFIWFF